MSNATARQQRLTQLLRGVFPSRDPQLIYAPVGTRLVRVQGEGRALLPGDVRPAHGGKLQTGSPQEVG